MTTNYMIKNCPALDDQGRCFQGSVLLGTAFKECEGKDCLLKQMVKMLKPHANFCDKCEGDEIYDCVDCTQGGKAIIANAVLEMLEISE